MNFMLQTRTVYTSVSLIKQSGQYHVAIILDIIYSQTCGINVKLRLLIFRLEG